MNDKTHHLRNAIGCILCAIDFDFSANPDPVRCLTMMLKLGALIFSLILLLSRFAPAAETKIELIYPNGLAVDSTGNLLITDIAKHQILKLDKGGTLSVVAGSGEGGFGGDGGPAVAAQLHAPHDITFDNDGNLLIADTFNHRIRRIDSRGTISTVAGDGKTTTLNNPQSIAVDREGNLYIADTYNHVVKRIDRDGKMSIFAGSEAGLAGDKGPANKCQLNLPQAVAVAPDGTIYISDSANSRIRHVGKDGIIQTIAGSGPGSGEGGAGFGGDGGPAEKAKIFSPADLKFNSVGDLYFSDSGNNRIRVITHGVVVSIAGTGAAGLGGEGGKAILATFNTPQKIALAADGTIYIADRVNHRVRRVDSQGVITTVAGGSKAGGIMVDPTVLPKESKVR
jgi:sugar lactone lactonase YvrE